jgi:tRNA nucleotidyltransferase (CCA-adding enzyme)
MSIFPEKIVTLASAINEAGGRALLVGGCVRDLLRKVAPKDWDLEVYGLQPLVLRAVLEPFGKVSVVGEAFSVYKLDHDIDVSVPRRDRKSGKGHRGFVIEGDPEMSPEEAARRRDFTINAIMQDPLTLELLDPHHGQEDLKNKILRAVSADTFGEDSLRVLRAAQFAARFELEVDFETEALCQNIDLTDLPPERIWGEIQKLLLKANRPSIGFEFLRRVNALDQLFPEIKALIDVPQDPEWHPEGEVFRHTMLTVDRARELIDDLPYAKQVTVMVAALAHDFGKPATTEFIEGRWRSRGHEEAGIAPTEKFLDRLNLHSLDGYDVRRQVLAIVKDHLKPGEFYKKRDEVGDGAFRRLARKCEPDLLYRVARADSLGRNDELVPREKWYGAEAQEWFIERVRELEIEQRPPAPLLMGRHVLELGLEPGPEVGEITQAVYEMQMDNRVRTLEEAKAAAKQMIEAEKRVR